MGGVGGVPFLQVAGNVLQGAGVFLVLWLAARLLRRIIRRALAGKKVRADVALLTERVLYVTLIGLGAFMFIALALGQSATALAGVLVAVFVASLGLQDLFKNYVAGFYVLMERKILPGREITTGNFTGVVTEVQMRTTYLRTDRGEVVIVPNIELFSSTVAVRPDEGDGGSVEGAQDDSRKGGQAAPREV
jgi:small-conductance mechanosensitive channel